MCTKIFGTAILVKNLQCSRKRNNIHDPFAIAVLKSDVIVGHIPRAISAACYVFLGGAGSFYSFMQSDWTLKIFRSTAGWT